MSTHLFQIGDIVRINPPTLKQWAEIRTCGFYEDEIAPYIGQFAVVVETWNDTEHVSDGCNLRIRYRVPTHNETSYSQRSVSSQAVPLSRVYDSLTETLKTVKSIWIVEVRVSEDW